MTQQLKVPSTSRLVLEAAMQLYTTPLQQRYIESIDFSETSRIFYELKRYYPLVIDTICFRKQSIRAMLRERITQAPGQQVILLGAGLDPLSLYLLENYREQISRIIEIDNGYIEEKQRLYAAIIPEEPLIRFSRCDVTDTVLLRSKLLENGYREDLPAIIVFEGVIHYVSNEAFINTMKLFKTPNKQHLVMLDYTLSPEDVPTTFLPYHEGVLRMLETYVGAPLNVNSHADMAGIIYQLDAALENLEPMCETERKITGYNKLFHAPGEGIIEMLSFSL
ncbi:class I SAM-dependent methyltransferase [Chitinophaga sp.]|uniref:class I SAM-dependent methyltransferase n=1 Tax=Chitinophaga sp. TaxID=1869181 RepID=UPI002F93CA91